MASTYYSQAKLKTCFFFKEAPNKSFNTPRKIVGSEKFPVAPLSLKHALRPPTDLYTSSAFHTTTILSIKKITGENASTETYHIVFDHGRFLPHWEGQVFGVMPAPKNPFIVGNSSQLRYLTSASSRYGDLFNGRTTSLCVSLSVGSTSEVLIKSKPGDKIQLIVQLDDNNLSNKSKYRSSRCRIDVELTDSSAWLTTVVFGEIAETLFSCNATTLMNTKIKASDNILKELSELYGNKEITTYIKAVKQDSSEG
ncbi:hypothetical protein F8388_005670 [Cannabis sativa]|uniref:Uncharacterized protein n=1 Tax=Cannabis sativa TaxID=3483 RepID=A0A7J6DS94_CANSA|nr:hypothetical protein F8388_005670 [Cannabis sativa]